MFGSLGFPEILFILVLALLVFGPRKLPEVGRTIGRALGEFRRATGDLKRSFDQEMNAEVSARPERRTEAKQTAPSGSSADDPDADADDAALEEGSDGAEPAGADSDEAADESE